MTFVEYVGVLLARPVGGAGAALPRRHLPGVATDRARRGPHRGARRHHRVARRADPPGRLVAAGRVGGADVRRRGRLGRGGPTAGAGRRRPAGHRQRAGVPGAGAQRDVPSRRAGGPARLGRRSASWTESRGRLGRADAAWEAALAPYWEEHDRLLTDADARGPHLLVVDTGEAATRAGGGFGRSCTTRTTTTTGASAPRSTSMHPTRLGSPSYTCSTSACSDPRPGDRPLDPRAPRNSQLFANCRQVAVLNRSIGPGSPTRSRNRQTIRICGTLTIPTSGKLAAGGTRRCNER